MARKKWVVIAPGGFITEPLLRDEYDRPRHIAPFPIKHTISSTRDCAIRRFIGELCDRGVEDAFNRPIIPRHFGRMITDNGIAMLWSRIQKYGYKVVYVVPGSAWE